MIIGLTSLISYSTKLRHKRGVHSNSTISDFWVKYFLQYISKLMRNISVQFLWLLRLLIFAFRISSSQCCFLFLFLEVRKTDRYNQINVSRHLFRSWEQNIKKKNQIHIYHVRAYLAANGISISEQKDPGCFVSSQRTHPSACKKIIYY